MSTVPDDAPRVRLTIEFQSNVLDDDLTFDDVSHTDGIYMLIDDRRWDFVDDEDVVGVSPGPLLRSQSFAEPGEQSKTIVLGRCSCGEIGCGCISARCYLLDSQTVVWDVFRSVAGPPLYTKPKPNPGALLFDREQYETEVRDATSRYDRWNLARFDS